VRCRSRPADRSGKAEVDGRGTSELASVEPAGVVATTCRQRGPDATREAPAVIAVKDQLVTRERQTGPYGVAERLVLPMKPGNAGGGKGPQLKGNATSDKGPRDWR
jgi:hypothetical protein